MQILSRYSHIYWLNAIIGSVIRLVFILADEEVVRDITSPYFEPPVFNLQNFIKLAQLHFASNNFNEINLIFHVKLTHTVNGASKPLMKEIWSTNIRMEW